MGFHFGSVSPYLHKFSFFFRYRCGALTCSNTSSAFGFGAQVLVVTDLGLPFVGMRKTRRQRPTEYKFRSLSFVAITVAVWVI